MNFLSHLLQKPNASINAPTVIIPSAPPSPLISNEEFAAVIATPYTEVRGPIQVNAEELSSGDFTENTSESNESFDPVKGELIDEKEKRESFFSFTKVKGTATDFTRSFYEPIQKMQTRLVSKEYAIECIEKNPKNFFKIRKEWQKDTEVITIALLLDPKIFETLSEDLKNLPEIQNARLLGEEKACVEGKIPFSSCSKAVRSNFEIAKEAVGKSVSNLLHLGEEITKNNEQYDELLLIAAANDPVELLTKVGNHKVLTNQELLLICCQNNSDAFKKIPKHLQEDLSFALKAVEKNPMVWSLLPEELKENLEIGLVAIKNNPEKNPFNSTQILSLPKTLQQNRKICLFMLKMNPGMNFWHHVPEILSLDSSFIKEVEENIPSFVLWKTFIENQNKKKKEILDCYPEHFCNTWVNKKSSGEILNLLMKEDPEFKQKVKTKFSSFAKFS